MRCASCGSDNPEGTKFCGECGVPIQTRCPQCGFENLPSTKFCRECGTALQGVSEPAPAKSRKPKGAKTSGPAARPKARATPARPQVAAQEAERRQLTVMFCDLVGSTPLAERLDPEELRTVILAYQEVCSQVVRHFDGYLARYAGDGLLVYFGYPVAHDNDAQRAVQAGLGIITEMRTLNVRLHPTVPVLQELPLQARIGIHTGLVIAGDMGGAGFPDPLAIVGKTPNIAARLQGIAEPNTVVMSATTARLVRGLFTSQALGLKTLKGVSVPLAAYRVLAEGEVQSRFEVAVQTGLTPLVGREEELGLLRQRWEQAKAGHGQILLLNGEPGIGKSRLVQEFKEQLAHEEVTRIEFRCSPYHQNSALYPIIEHLQRLLQFHREEAPQTKLVKLQLALSHYRFPQANTVVLLAALLSLPHPDGAPPITLSPQKQKQKTQEALVAWIVEETEKAAVFCAWEDLHWADPSTLELLTSYLEQIPTPRVFSVLTFRPDFTPPWGPRSYLTQLTLSRLGRTQVETMVEQVAGGKTLPLELIQQIVAKTDGVPLFVEELTKMVVESRESIESVGSEGVHGRSPLPLGIPATLQDALMARLDRLAPVRGIAQVGAVLGREFSYELIHAVSPLDEAMLQQGLRQLVEAELIYQRGLPPQAIYLFKHALVQDTAYQSLLKSTRQKYHQQIAQVLEEKFSETKEAQPELLAHHYTEAGLIAQAIPYWQRAGEKAAERLANIEAISHVRKGLALLQTLPATAEHIEQELTLQMLLSVALMVTKGFGAPEVAEVQVRLQALCQQVGETPQVFRALPQLRGVYCARGELDTARTLAEQYLALAQRFQVPILLVWASYGLGETLLFSGEVASARVHLEQGITAYDPQQVRAFFVRTVQDPGVACLSHTAAALWYLGFPDQALERIRQALTLAHSLAHPFSVAWTLCYLASHHQLRRDEHLVQEQAEAAIQLAQEQGFPFWIARAETFRGWALAQQGQGVEGIAQIHRGMEAYRAQGVELYRPQSLALIAEAYGQVGQGEEGLKVLAEALEVIHKTEVRLFEAEVHRLKGELTLQKSQVSGLRSQATNPQAPTRNPEAEAEAEACFHKALEVARRQSAKSLELRAVVSLSQLWQTQGKKDEARQMLADIYGWFTEGFETKDLQEAKALLQELV